MEDLEASSPPQLDDMSNFDVVFRPATKGQGAPGAGRAFVPKATPYGQGIPLRLATLANVQRIQPDDGGSVEVLVGVAFRHAALKETPPFVGSSRSGQTKKRMEAQQKANIRALKLQETGLDHVIPAESTAEQALRIYWVAGAAVPLASVLMRLHLKCGICLEQKLKQEGCQCSRGHFFCWGCFEMLLNNAKQPGATERMVRGSAFSPLLCVLLVTASLPRHLFDLH
jgi:hypothetical protein